MGDFADLAVGVRPNREWDGGGTMRKQRWKARIAGGLIALTGLGLAGCKHQLFLEPADWKEATRPNIPLTLESQPHEPIVPPNVSPSIRPATVIDSKRQLRPLSLKEAFAIAIEQGNTGGGGGSNTFNGQDSLALPGFSGRGTTGTDTIKAFVLDPAITQAEVERSLSKFDARWVSSMTWAKQDQATLSLQQSFSNGDSAALTSTLAKPLPTGGMAGITVSMNYLNLASAPTNSQFISLTTSYTPRVQFIFEQPLLQGFGIEANQLLNAHPGSVLIPGLRPSGGSGSEGILVSRVRTAQARSQFDSQVNQLLFNVEQAYWNLYAAYYNKRAQEIGLDQAFGLYETLRRRADAGAGVPYTKQQAEAQYWLFRQQVITARQQVLDADRSLRGLLGMKSGDGTVFSPTDEPVKALFTPDIDTVYFEALQTRPELMIARQEVKARQLDLLNQKQQRMPDARFFTSYDVNALNSGLGSSIGDLRQSQFNSWQVGLRLDMPLGFRDANALTRQSQLSLWKSYEQLRDSERKVYEGVVDAIRQMELSYATTSINEARKNALEVVVKQQSERLGKLGTEDFISQINGLIQSQRDLATAISEQYRGLANYNAALARLEYVKGTIQGYNNVNIAEGPLPAFVQKKAADHFRALNAAIKLREHPGDGLGVIPPSELPGGMQSLPQMPGGQSNLPDLLPPPLSAPKQQTNAGQPAPGALRTWESWQSTPSNSGVAVPGTLPKTLSPGPTSTDTPATFKPTGSVNLPRRPLAGAATIDPAVPIAPPALSGPTTPILQIPPR